MPLFRKNSKDPDKAKINKKDNKDIKTLKMKTNVSADELMNMEPEQAVAEISNIPGEELITITQEIDNEIAYLEEIISEANNAIMAEGLEPVVQVSRPAADPSANMEIDPAMVEPKDPDEDEDELVRELETMKRNRRAKVNQRAITANEKKRIEKAEKIETMLRDCGMQDDDFQNSINDLADRYSKYKANIVKNILEKNTGWTNERLANKDAVELELIANSVKADVPVDYGIRGMQKNNNESKGIAFRSMFDKKTGGAN